MRLQELLKAHGPSDFPITVRQLPDTNDFRFDTFFFIYIFFPFSSTIFFAFIFFILYFHCLTSKRNGTTHRTIHSYFFFRPLLKQIKNSAVAHIVLDCSTEKIYDVLKQSQQIGMMSDYHSYLITSLVMQKKT